MKRWLQIAISGAVAGASLAMEPDHWDLIRSEALLVLSVLAGAVLFRLGRGLPSISIDHLEVDEARSLAETYRVVTRRLAYVAGVTALALIGLATVGILHRLIATYLPPDSGAVLAALVTAMLAALIAFAFCRAVDLVLGDLSSVTVQSESIVKGVQRRHAREQDEALDKAGRDEPFEEPSNYGDLVKHH